MLKVVKAKKYHLRVKVQTFTRMAALISQHPVHKSIVTHFHPCNPVLLPQNTCSILFCGIFLTNLFINAIWQTNVEIEDRNFFDQP